MREIMHTSKHCPIVGGWDETWTDQISFCQQEGKLKALNQKGLLVDSWQILLCHLDQNSILMTLECIFWKPNGFPGPSSS